MKNVISLLLVLLLAIVSTTLLYADNNLSIANGDDLHLQEIQRKVDSIQGTSSDNALVDEEQVINGDNPDEIDAKRGPEIHECHSGSAHRKCHWYNFDYTCGCVKTYYECCCGKKMGYVHDRICDKHK